MLTEKDIEQIQEHDLSLNQVVKQLETFARGISFVDVVTTATVGNGIQIISEEQQKELVALYERRKNRMDIVKFVPASGAATRMFKFLHEFLENFNPNELNYRDYLKAGAPEDIETFFNGVKEFAFINAIRAKIREMFPDYKQSNKGERHTMMVRALLGEEGLNFDNLPKGLIPFHKYNKYATTAFEEQLYEAAYYAAVGDEVYLHFTFSEDHLELFKEEFEAVKSRLSRNTKKNFNITYSFQKKETDTLAVTQENKPYRNEEGKLVFRPSGHGALLNNLNEVDADLIFVKNIDNVAAQEYVEKIAHHKMVLAGKLIQVQKKIFSYLKELEEEVSLERIREIHSFVWNELHIKDIPNARSELVEVLNKPIRVCGVVKNTGAPGGGPFWVRDENGYVSLQIVETSQIDTDDAHQMRILQEATHFNPVDLVCGVRNYKGEKFDLGDYKDPQTGFISQKFEGGTPIKALELPGLWNGSMSKWNTLFVEVPLITFNPVKTVNDLLNKEHRPNA